MKFGKVLQQSQQVSSAAWEPNWVDYKLLKRIIKDCAQIQKEEKLEGSKLVKTKIKPNAKEDNDSIRTSPDEENFFRTLRSEIKKIGDFFLREQAAYISRVKEIEAVFLELQTDPKPETKTELMKRCVALYKELLLLENFAVMNFCGISKILKKHDKWTGYATRNKFMRTILMKQPFATYLPLLQMIDRLEHIFMEATGNSIDQHHSRRRGGGSGGAGATSDATTQSPSSNNHGNSGAATGGGSSSSPNHTTSSPSHQTGGSSHVNNASNSPSRVDPGYDSPAQDGAVTLGRVHALRDDARQFRETEGVDDSYDGDDSADSGDDAAMRGGMGSPQSDPGVPTAAMVTTASASATVPDMTMRHSMEPTSSRVAGLRKDYNSDSDAAAIAMLSMKEAGAASALAAGVGAGFRSGSDSEGGARFKRKACSPLPPTNGKRKMSFATILN